MFLPILFWGQLSVQYRALGNVLLYCFSQTQETKQQVYIKSLNENKKKTLKRHYLYYYKLLASYIVKKSTLTTVEDS